MPDTFTITDNRTGKSVEVPIINGGVSSKAVRELDPNLWIYDPAFMQTASCESSISYIDGDKGILRYRGYPIEQLAEKSNYLEVAYLLLNGELPTAEQYSDWVESINRHSFVHENLRRRFVEGFRHDAHPMGMFVAGLAALGSYYPDSKDVHDPDVRRRQIVRLLAKSPVLAAYCHRYSAGQPTQYPNNLLDYSTNFLNMYWKLRVDYEIDPRLARALDILFILHADHEQNCSTTTMRVIGSAHADPYVAASGAAAALYGPLHGGANEAVVRMLQDIGSIDHVDAFIAAVKDGSAGSRLMGFGHRVYKNYDPRAAIVKKTAYEVFEVTGSNPLLDIALRLEEVALNDEYFQKRKLYPNVDFYSGLIYQAMGFRTSTFTVLFAIPRMAGWLAHWQEMITDPQQKISRPRQLYTGADTRDYVSMEQRA